VTIQELLFMILGYLKYKNHIIYKDALEQAIRQLQNREPITNKLIVEETRNAKSPI
jgi:hypothetical protein